MAVADRANLAPAGYVGIVSANKEPDKIGKAGWTAYRGKQADAPVIQELPVAMECKPVSAEGGKITYVGMETLAFVSANLGYYVVDERLAAPSATARP